MWQEFYTGIDFQPPHSFAKLDAQVLAVFDKMRIEDEGVRDWFQTVLDSQTRGAQSGSRAQRVELRLQETLIVGQEDGVPNLRLTEDIDQEMFARKHTELRARLASINLHLFELDRSQEGKVELASKVFKLSQNLRQQMAYL